MEDFMSIVARFGDNVLRGIEYIVCLIVIAIILTFLGLLAFFNMLIGD
jgi:hypothetical protein